MASPLIIAVDAAAVTFLNSIGVTFLIGQTQAARQSGRRPILRRPSKATRLIVNLTGVSTLFDILET